MDCWAGAHKSAKRDTFTAIYRKTFLIGNAPFLLSHNNSIGLVLKLESEPVYRYPQRIVEVDIYKWNRIKSRTKYNNHKQPEQQQPKREHQIHKTMEWTSKNGGYWQAFQRPCHRRSKFMGLFYGVHKNYRIYCSFQLLKTLWHTRAMSYVLVTCEREKGTRCVFY